MPEERTDEMQALIAKWREMAAYWDSPCERDAGPNNARCSVYSLCADELEAALGATSPARSSELPTCPDCFRSDGTHPDGCVNEQVTIPARSSVSQTEQMPSGCNGNTGLKSSDEGTPVGSTRYVVGGYSGNQLEPLVEAMLRDADTDPNGREPLREIIRALSLKLKPECPCGLHAEPWHVYGVCDQGAKR